MLIAYCFVAITSGTLSTAALWPWMGPLALVAAPFSSSIGGIALVVALTLRGGLTDKEHLNSAEEHEGGEHLAVS
jgi:hypothetical protein